MNIKRSINIKPSERIEELESIRGLAALLVVFYHLPKWHSFLNISLINNGYLMVQLFFVLSGFVIYNAYSEKINSNNDLYRFQFLRFARLYPVHLLFLVIFLLIELIKYIATKKYGFYGLHTVPFETNNLWAFIKHIFLISSVLPNQPVTFNYPAWSISVEFYTYLFFGLSILIIKKRNFLFFSIIAIIALIMIATETTFGFDAILSCFAGFFIGSLIAGFIKKSTVELPQLVSLFAFIGIVLFLQFKPANKFDLLIYFFSALMIITIVVGKNGWFKKALQFPVLLWLGSISYSVYMSHAAVEWFYNQIIKVVLKKPEIIGKDGNTVPQLSQSEAIIACLIVLISILLVSAFVNTYIEKPFREMAKKFSIRKFKNS